MTPCGPDDDEPDSPPTVKQMIACFDALGHINSLFSPDEDEFLWEALDKLTVWATSQVSRLALEAGAPEAWAWFAEQQYRATA